MTRQEKGRMTDGLPVGTMVHTERGMVPIEQVEIGDRVMTCDGHYEKVVGVKDLDKLTMLRIETKAGDFRCAPNQRLAVLTYDHRILWVAAKLLKSGMRLVRPRMPTPGTDVSFPGYPHIIMEGTLARFVGHYASTGNFSFCTNRKQETDTMVSMFQKFKATIMIRRYRLDNNRLLLVPPSDLRTTFEKYITRHKVPTFIWQSPLHVRMAFLDGAMAENKFITPEWSNVLSILFSSCGVEMNVIPNGLEPSNTYSKELLNRLWAREQYNIPFWKKMCCCNQPGPLDQFFGTTPLCSVKIADRCPAMDLMLEREDNFYTDGYLSRCHEVKKKEKFFLS